MPTPQELEDKFWKALEADRIVMLGLDGAEEGHTRPMTAQLEGRRSPIWFFASRDMALVQKLDRTARAIATFASKNHELFATLHGTLSISNEREVVEHLWNKHVAEWYEGGKSDPKLALLRLDAQRAEIWRHDSSVFSGVKTLLGRDPKHTATENTAEVRLD